VALAGVDFLARRTDHARVGLLEGTAVLLISGVLAYLTTRFVENPLRDRGPAVAPKINPAPLWVRIRRPTIALGSAVALLGVALTATSFTWREHVIVQRANGNELASLPDRDYPGARALTNRAKVPQLPTRPTVLEARNDLPATTTDGCISDFGNPALINCTVPVIALSQDP
jgi:hypothetical protein